MGFSSSAACDVTIARSNWPAAAYAAASTSRGSASRRPLTGLLFVAPTLAGGGPGLTAKLAAPVALHRLHARQVGADVLLSAYVHDP